MDFFFENHSRTNLCLLIFNFLSCIPLIFSLSTISISETSNHTLICAIMQSSTNPQPYLNCTSFPPGIQIPTNSFNTSLSGIVGGDGFLCALGSPSSIMVCWRFSANGTNMIFKRIYDGLRPDLYELDAGNSHICGLVKDTNRLECWQWKEFDSTNQKFSSHIAVGENFVCGLLETGEVKCLGDDARVVGFEPVNGGYSVVAAGFNHACAISSYGSLDCRGVMVGEKPQGDQFTSLALGRNRSCALRYNQTVVCWGENNFRLPDRLQGIYFTAIEAKRNVFCGVLSSNYSLYCWGNENFDSNFMVFENVQPGPCRSKCPCGILTGSSKFCDQEFICQPCLTRATTPPLPPAPAPQKSKSSRWNRKMVAFLVVGCVGSLSLVVVICFLVFRYGKCRGCRIHDSGRLDETGMNAPQANQSAQANQSTPLPVLEKRLSQLTSMGTNGSHLEEFPLQVLLQTTDNFSNERKIGTGSFGSVYHAMLEDRRDVAIKRAEVSTTSSYAGTKRGQQDKDSAFLNELEFLSRLNHKNLVRLIGFCEDVNELILVYEYMANGSLHDHLHKIQSSHLMSWTTRLKVALDAARGIEYLHSYAVPQIIHRDIKSSNILLDATWTAKVSDFGLSLMGPADNEEHLSLGAAGTVGYLDPEYYRLQQLTTKSDVYSYGVVLLELLSGNKAIHRNENGVPRNVVDFVVPYIVQDEIHRVLDPNVPPPTPFEIEAVAYVGYLAADCVSLEGRDRPGMTEIVNSLERALAACLTNPEHQRSKSRSSSIE